MDLAGVIRYEPVTVDASRRVAVIAPTVFRDERPRILFTKCTNHPGEHPGQMSSPDGGREPSDADLWTTTLRESNEEIGFRPEGVAFHGRLDDI